MLITYKENSRMEETALKRLYNDVKWTNYTKDMPRLLKALEHSLVTISAYDQKKLVGLIRVVGDGQTIIFIQDILILEDYQHHGIGTELIRKVLQLYPEVRQKVLLTNDAPDVRAFYEKHGFHSCDQGDLVSFARFD